MTIIDVNNYAPTFDKPYTAFVDSATVSGTVVLSFSVVDADSEANGPPFTVECSGATECQYFQITGTGCKCEISYCKVLWLTQITCFSDIPLL